MDATFKEPDGDAVPISYAVLTVPPKAEMRKKGYNPEEVVVNGREAHPLSVWKTYSLPAGTSYKQAVSALQEANSKPWGLLKARLYFSDGRYEEFERRQAGNPRSFANLATYDPNEVFRAETMGRASMNRTKLQPRLAPLVDEKGHHTSQKKLPRTFAPEVLYRDCPPPVHSQAGFDFTPVSSNAFLLRPKDAPVGVRPVQSNFMQSSCDYRPRAYLRNGPQDSRHCHCAEVYQVGDYTMDLAKEGTTINHRNHLTVKEWTATGSLKQNSTIVGKRHAHAPRFGCTATMNSTAEAAEVPTAADPTATVAQETTA